MPRELEVQTEIDHIYDAVRRCKTRDDKFKLVFGLELAADLVRCIVSDLQLYLDNTPEDDRDDV